MNAAFGALGLLVAMYRQLDTERRSPQREKGAPSPAPRKNRKVRLVETTDAMPAHDGGPPCTLLLAAGFTLLRLDGTANDGMVPAPSTVWGDHRGTICADHADQVGLFADGETNTYDHLAFYRSEMRRLADLGF